MNVWTPEFLKKLAFPSNAELFNYLKIEALKTGFVLCSRSSLIEPYGRFYCSKGRKTEKATNKCNCTFSICSTPENRDGKYYFVVRIDSSLKLEHQNHQPNPRLYTYLLLSDDIKTRIQMFHDAGVKPTLIQKILLKMNIENISTLQIQSVIEKETIKTFNLQSEELGHCMKSKGGITHYLDLPSDDGITTGIAVLTIHKEEHFCR